MPVRDLIPRMRSRAPVSRSEGMNPLAAFHEEMNRLFDDFWRDFDGVGTSLMPSVGFPRVEVIETDRDVTVEAELPGMEEKDIAAWSSAMRFARKSPSRKPPIRPLFVVCRSNGASPVT